MPLRLGALHDALLHPGDADLAKRAAEELANYDNQLTAIRADIRILTWMVGAVGVLGLGNLWLSYAILGRLVDLAGTIGALAARLPQ